MVMTIIAKGTVKKDDWADSSGHWYCAKTGAPRYTIVGKNGKVRNTTIRDAREHGYVPSVSTILQLEAKPQLTRWLVNQAMMACLTLPRNEGESDDSFMARALIDSKQQAIKAAARGTYIHGLLEESVRQGAARGDATDLPYVFPVLEWLDKNFEGYTWSVERSFSCKDGYGGKMDLTGTKQYGRPVVIDYKCKDFKDDSKKMAYPEHVSQLAAYAQGLEYIAPRCINLFISSTVPGLYVAHEWTEQEILTGRDAFWALLALWKARKSVA